MLDQISAGGAASISTPTSTSGDHAVDASRLIAQVTDPRTGTVDVKALAGAVADAAHTSMPKASQAYADIEHALGQKSPADASRFNADVRDAVRFGTDAVTGTSTGLSAAGKRILVDNPILKKTWVSTTSPWTGKGGFTPGLEQMLKSHGIEVEARVQPRPPGGVGKTSGVPKEKAANINGSAARDQIADRYRAGGAEVKTEVKTQGGSRVVDVQADVKAKDPRMNQRIEVESKLGRTSNGADVRLQAAKDGEALAENAKLRGLGSGLETAGKIARPLAIAGDAIQLGQAFHEDGNTIGVHTERTAAGVAGGWAGAAAGAELGAAGGAALGSVVPVLGTAAGGIVGGIVGGVVGGIGGDSAGRAIFDGIKSLF